MTETGPEKKMVALMDKLVFLLFFLPLAGILHAAPLEKEYGTGENRILLSLSTNAVSRSGSCEMTIRPLLQDGKTAKLPDSGMENRFEGLSIEGMYTDPDGSIHFRLLPDPSANRLRIKPTPISIHASSLSGNTTGQWIIVGPIDLEIAPDAAGVEETLSPGFSAAHIGRGLRGWLSLSGLLLLALFLLFGLVLLVRHLLKMHHIRKLSPIERAFRELDDLLHRNLPEKGRFKDFYVELTLVIRRYIERSYGIRAPRLTTEEFLSVAQASPSFPDDRLENLRTFLSAADLIKFAGVEATIEIAAQATDCARFFLQTENPRETPAPTGKGAST
ncbi:MAG: hypothetical protein ACI4QT_04580 [Kiritimatiellia bacterium]